jgi:hypothetical protein
MRLHMQCFKQYEQQQQQQQQSSRMLVKVVLRVLVTWQSLLLMWLAVNLSMRRCSLVMRMRMAMTVPVLLMSR